MPLSDSWIQASVSVSPQEAEIAANWLLEQGCEGVQVEDTAILFDESEDATLVARDEVKVTGFMPGGPVELSRLTALERPFSGKLAAEPVDAQDWATKWRENFPPLEIGRFLIVPTWEDVTIPAGKIGLKLDPGLAFGTGQHPTTRMCLELLGEHLPAGTQVLDVGCGSGILSLAAAKLGATVVGSDLDPWCVQATRDNAVLNGVQVEVQERADLEWVKAPFPVVIANLMSDLLIRLARELARVTSPGGMLIVSGISAQRANEVAEALMNAGFATKVRRQMDGETRGDGPEAWVERWAAFVFERA